MLSFLTQRLGQAVWIFIPWPLGLAPAPPLPPMILAKTKLEVSGLELTRDDAGGFGTSFLHSVVQQGP